MASIKLLRDSKTGNTYECLLNDKGEIVQEHFIPSSEVTKHPKFTAPLEEKNVHKYFIPELLMKKPTQNTVISNRVNDNLCREYQSENVYQVEQMFNNYKIIKDIELRRNIDSDSYSLITSYTDNTFQQQKIPSIDFQSYTLKELHRKYPNLQFIKRSAMSSIIKNESVKQSVINGTNMYNKPVKKPFPKEIAIGLLTVISVLSLLYIIGEKFSV